MDTNDYFDDATVVPQGERWPPLGAAAEPYHDGSFDATYDGDDAFANSEMWSSCMSFSEMEKLRLLEEEQEQLNSSLMALTSHFAQVQFRLRQIVEADTSMKEKLLLELEEFAFRGIPNFSMPARCVEGEQLSEANHDSIMEAHRQKQQKLILQLKEQLEDLERYAYETGEAGLPQTVLVERQKVIIDQLKGKLQLNVDDLDKCSVEDLRCQVDMAISQLVNPLKMKEQLVTQLKTQITDLERFIQFLQGPATTDKNQQCACSVHCSTSRTNYRSAAANKTSPNVASLHQDKVQQTLRKISNLLQLYVVSQFGCGSNISRNMTSQSPGSSGAEMKVRLDAAILHVLRIAQDGDDPDDEFDADLLKAVRKVLCPALRDLMAHGLVEASKTTSLIPFLSCAAPPRSRVTTSPSTHPWRLLLKYYRTKDGNSVMTNPQRSLAESFSLEIHGGTNKHSLLAAIGNVIASHEPYKRSPDAHFKSFVCKALNENKLASWLRILYRSPGLIKESYEPWSYAAKTGFDDALKSLEKLQSVPFRLAEDVAVRSLRNINEAF